MPNKQQAVFWHTFKKSLFTAFYPVAAFKVLNGLCRRYNFTGWRM